MIQTWQITPTENLKLDLDVSSLDEVTQRLPNGYYSTFRTFDGGRRVLGLTSHLQRLYKPVSTPDVDESLLRQRLSKLLELYRSGEARVRAVMTREGQVYLSIAPLSLLPRAVYEKGVRVETTELRRKHPRLKSTAFIDRSDSERKRIEQDGIFEALLIKDGKILEGMTSNFFYMIRAEHASTADRKALPSAPREDILCTARDGILLGITRETVLEIAQGKGLTVKYQPLILDQLEDISEAFITSSSRGIVPVVQIDQFTVGQGSPGPITRDLLASYEAYVVENAETIL